MRKHDVIACAFVIVVGLAWFAAAEVVYDGSLMEDPFLRCGMLAELYVPLATMYLIKVIGGEGRCSRAVAWLSSFLALWAMIVVDVWVTHYKPNCDYCCIPANECLLMESVGAAALTALASVSDVLAMHWTRGMSHPLARHGFCRRALRLAGTVLVTWLLFMATGAVIRSFAKFIREVAGA